MHGILNPLSQESRGLCWEEATSRSPKYQPKLGQVAILSALPYFSDTAVMLFPHVSEHYLSLPFLCQSRQHIPWTWLVAEIYLVQNKYFWCSLKQGIEVRITPREGYLLEYVKRKQIPCTVSGKCSYHTADHGHQGGGRLVSSKQFGYSCIMHFKDTITVLQFLRYDPQTSKQ